MKSVEDLINVPINEDGSCFFLVSSSMSESERQEMFAFLKAKIEVFAWTSYEMPRVDPVFISHNFNFDPTKCLVQKPINLL